MTAERWRLSLGCHRGRWSSRNIAQPRYCSSLEECREEVARTEESWRAHGCYVWFATARREEPAPHLEVELHQGTPYG